MRPSNLGIAILFSVAAMACSGGAGFVAYEHTAAECGDKIDNDGDGKIDCNDPDCRQQCGGKPLPDSGTPTPDLGPLPDLADKPPFAVCAETFSEATLIGGEGVDIIWIIDTSASMMEELGWLTQNLNAFSTFIGNQKVDYRVVLIGAGLLPFLPICVDPPLGGPNCTNGPRYLNIIDDVGSTDGLERLVKNYSKYQHFLRPKTVKHFVMISDDDSRDTPKWFRDQLAKLQNPGFKNGFVFNSIVSFEPGVAPDQQPDDGCSTGASFGSHYHQLSTETGGAVFPICRTDWRPMFLQLALEVTKLIKPSCSYQLPSPGDGKKINPSQIQVTYFEDTWKAEIPQVDDLSKCGANHGFYYDDINFPSIVTFCPKTCSSMQGGKVHIVFGCTRIG